MKITIALAGNPNCGKTTLFNTLTGGMEYVGNWPGVTVEKKDGVLKGHRDVVIQDLPGIYSLSPYSLEETVARNYLVTQRPDVIINIIDGTNIERNLYLTTQLLELGIPVIAAINMVDLIRKKGDNVDIEQLSRELNCEVVTISALKKEGCLALVEKAISLAGQVRDAEPHVFTGSVEHALAHIEESIGSYTDKISLRWYAIKIFERDKKAIEPLHLEPALSEHLELHIADCEKELDDDAESIIVNQRYAYIAKIIAVSVQKKAVQGSLTVSDKIDRIVTNRILALPIFAAIMTFMYYISITTVGSAATDWVNDTLFGDVITNAATGFLDVIAAPDWLSSLIIKGIIGGVGTVLGFVPQIILIFLFLSILEDSGYMARVAFIMDRVFRKFGLSGKSFIPVLIGTGCGVPAIMAARTIEDEKDRRMTIMLSTFIPCTAKSVIIGMITTAFFPDSIFIAPAMYFLGIAIIICSGIILKKTSYFGGDPAPFVMELPAYHIPSVKGVLIHMWERARAFIIKAGTIIFSACMIIWFLSSFDWSLSMLADEDIGNSMLASIGGLVSWIFSPLGFGDWKGAVAVISAEMAKEQAIGTLAILNGVADPGNNESVMQGIQTMFTPMAAFSYMILNLFDPPCVVAMSTIAREMNSKKWAAIAIGYQVVTGYIMAFIFYQLGMYLYYGAAFGAGQGIAVFLLAMIIYLLIRPEKYSSSRVLQSAGNR